jgi:methionine-rich copper-binding protein CopC
MNSMRNPELAATAMGCCLFFALHQAGAHARLISATPAAGATVAAPKIIKVRFNEAIEAKLSGLKLSTAGKEVAAPAVSDPADPAALAIVPAAPLPPGAYQVSWSAVSQDGHRTRGVFVFTVK